MYYMRYGMGMWEEYKVRLSRRVLEWCSTGRRNIIVPLNSWMQEIGTGMRDKGLEELDWQGGTETKDKTLGTEHPL